MNHVINTGILFCTPHPFVPGPVGPRLALIPVEWHRARQNLSMPTNINTVTLFADGMEVGDARQFAVEEALKMETVPEFVFFLDYDVCPEYNALTKLLFRARHFPDHDIFAGVYCLKADPPEPLIYKEWGVGPYWDWAIGDLLTEGITGVHMGLTLLRTSLLKRMDAGKPFFLTQNEQFVMDGAVHSNRGTEDLYFCRRAVEEAGAKIFVDTSVLAAHVNISTGQKFGIPRDSWPVLRAKWLSGDDEYKAEKKALDLGAGATRRQWDGHTTYTTDIREGVGADYVMDTLLLNLPDDHFDLVASSHHLEHLPRWEQETVWKEIFRVTKPGGRIEHTVPNLAWAAAMIAEGEVDEHVYNVLYGAQEEHGYRREHNTHFFGYTADVGRALAEGAGFVDVETEDYTTAATLGYNLVIRGRKPDAGETDNDSGGKAALDDDSRLP